jgi:hypothetical protein
MLNDDETSDDRRIAGAECIYHFQYHYRLVMVCQSKDDGMNSSVDVSVNLAIYIYVHENPSSSLLVSAVNCQPTTP